MSVVYIDGMPSIDDGSGEFRKLAALPPEPMLMASASMFSDVAAPDPSSWRDCDLLEIVEPDVRDQKQTSACVGFSSVTAMDIIRRKMGQTPVKLSCTFLYAQINGGRDQGASVSAGLKALQQYGTCTEAECGITQIFKNQIPQSAYETAKKYQIHEAYLCRSFDELCEAVNLGFTVVFGIQIGANFSRLSPEGIAPLPDRIVGGHALCGVGLRKAGSDWLLKFQNSWTPNWGNKGCAFLTRRHFSQMTDGYAIMYAENQNPPPVARMSRVEGTASMVHVSPDDLAN
jgi:hypothetical protein